MDIDGSKRVFHRLGPPSTATSTSNDNNGTKIQKVCYHWRAGNCTRRPCNFLHSELPGAPANGKSISSKRGYGFNNTGDDQYSGGGGGGGGSGGGLRRNQNFSNSWGRPQPNHHQGSRPPTVKKLCNYWIQGRCTFGDNCRFLHAWSTGDCFKLLTKLEGHQNVVTGIALPSGSDKLYTGSKDESVRVWDCQSGQCGAAITMTGEVACMISEGPWVFVGLTNIVRAWNTQTSTDLSLSGPNGIVYAIVVGNDLLFAGVQDGNILAWKFDVTTNNFVPAASLSGHASSVVSLIVGANRLYSGSMDNSIKVWNLENLQCLQTLTDHTSVVMSLLCWDQFLLSGSLDNTIKVWALTESGKLEVTFTHKEEHGILVLCGMHDLEGKPVLLCSCNDSTVRVYDLPSFSERGKIFSEKEMRSIEIGPSHLFFTGDGTGKVKVWQWSAEQHAAKPALGN